MPDSLIIRRAVLGDEAGIAGLIHEIYEGTYPDPLLTSMKALRANLMAQEDYFIVACDQDRIVASLLYKVDRNHQLAKASGAVVRPEYRGQDLTQRLMHFGLEELQKEGSPLEAIYATTRTVTRAPQKLTSQLGFKKLGIFPNVHKTEDYETHCLTCFFSKTALNRRYTDFSLHHRIASLYGIVQSEVDLPDLPIATREVIESQEREPSRPVPPLEYIDAPKFVLHRFEMLKQNGLLPISFLPFHKPNILITSPDQEVEIFLTLEKSDQHCVIVGMKKPREVYHSLVYHEVCSLLRARGVRYLETLVRADKVLTLNETLKAGFIPCAYFPAFQLYKGYRLDFVILSRTFEMLDLSHVELEGTNRRYLQQYYESWKALCLDPILLATEPPC